MAFRVTSFAIENQAIQFAARHSADIFKFQQQITSGVRLHRPSDDPIAFRQVSSLNTRFNELIGELATIRSTEGVLNNSVSQLQEASRLITSAVTAVQQGIQSVETIDRNALALEVDGLLNQLKSIANSTFNGEFLYGGTNANRQPFSFDAPPSDGRSITTIYSGAARNSVVLIGGSLAVDNYYNGEEIFGRGERQPTIIYGQTGAQPGAGTDTLTSRAQLQVIHDLTTYDGVSGIIAGLSSVELDSVIGQHDVTIIDTSGDGSAGTISLNGGKPVSFNNTLNDLRVTGPNGEVIYVDTTAIAVGYSGTVQLNSSGFLSIDDGQTTTAIDFSENQIVTDSISGGFVTIDSRNVREIGLDHLEFPGTSDAFQLLFNLASDLRNERSLNTSELTESLDRRFSELENAQEEFLSFIGEQSTSLRTLESVAFRNETLQLQVQIQASDLQATDISEAVLRLSNAEALLQYTFAVTSQITSINILDFLR